MDELKKGLSYTFAQSGKTMIASFDDYSLASLMFESNALITVETAIQLCSLSLEDMNYRIRNGRFPCPLNLSLDDTTQTLAFRIRDIAKWLEEPNEFYTSQATSSSGPTLDSMR